MASMPVARMGYDAFQQNQRVKVTGARNVVLAGLVNFLPRASVLKLVRNLQSPA
jgi:short-subunit dehydrogenase